MGLITADHILPPQSYSHDALVRCCRRAERLAQSLVKGCRAEAIESHEVSLALYVERVLQWAKKIPTAIEAMTAAGKGRAVISLSRFADIGAALAVARDTLGEAQKAQAGLAKQLADGAECSGSAREQAQIRRGRRQDRQALQYAVTKAARSVLVLEKLHSAIEG